MPTLKTDPPAAPPPSLNQRQYEYLHNHHHPHGPPPAPPPPRHHPSLGLLGRIFGSESANQQVLTQAPFGKNLNNSLFDGPASRGWDQAVQQRTAHNLQLQQQELVQSQKRKASPVHTKDDPEPSIFRTRPRASPAQSAANSIQMPPEKKKARNQTISSKFLMQATTLDIPREFQSKKVSSVIETPKEEEDQEQDALDMLRAFTRQGDAVLRKYGFLYCRRKPARAEKDSHNTNTDKQQHHKHGSIFSKKLLKSIRRQAMAWQDTLVEQLDKTVGEDWRKIHTDDEKDNALSSFSYAEVASRCPGRLDIKYPIDDPCLVDSPWLMPLIRSLLGSDAKLVYCGLVVSFPGALDQPWHQDGHPLFPELFSNDKHSPTRQNLPPYALNVFVPLVPVTDEVGPTQFWAASHLEANFQKVQHELREQNKKSRGALSGELSFASLESTGRNEAGHGILAPNLQVGDILIYDYRTCHRGTANQTPDTVRPMLYLMYARPWFQEHVNFGKESIFGSDDDYDSEDEEGRDDNDNQDDDDDQDDEDYIEDDPADTKNDGDE